LERRGGYEVPLRIRERRFLQVSLFVPLVLPLVFTPLYSPSQASVGTTIAGILLVSLVFGGIPYLLLVLGLLWWGRSQRAVDMVWAGWMMPLFLAPLSGLLVGAVMAYDASPGRRLEAATLYGGLSLIYSLVLGYAYVALVMCAKWCLGRLGILEWEAKRAVEQ